VSMTKASAPPHPERTVSASWRIARKVTVALIGTVVMAAGVALIVLPGPAIIVIPFGLAILATEFPWAHRLLLRMKTFLQSARERAARWLGRRGRRVPAASPAPVEIN
jgi:uncharacterized protein (TIGR02611 family)